MAVVIAANLNDAGWQQALSRMGHRAPRAQARALNRTALNVRAAMAPVIARDIGLKVGEVRQEFRIANARPDSLRARVEVRGARVPVFKLNARGPFPSRGRGNGVRWRSGQGRKHARQAFIAEMRSGHKGVFTRKAPSTKRSAGAWSKNLPIVELFGPSLPHVFRKHLPVGIARAQEQLMKNMAHEFRFVLSKS